MVTLVLTSASNVIKINSATFYSKANPQVHSVGWLFNGNELRPSSDSGGNNNNNSIEIRNNSIIIKSVKKDHIGAYRCFAANSLGRGVSEVVNLNVKCKQVIIIDLSQSQYH